MSGKKHPSARGVLGTLIQRVNSWLWRFDFEVFSSCPISVGGDPRAMLDGTIDEPFKTKQNRFVYRLDSSAGIFYLKRTNYQSLRSILRNLLRGRVAHTASGWEYLAIRSLEAQGLPVMQPVAWGEERLLGIWPRRGFLLVKEVGGDALAEIMFGVGDATLRCEAFGAIGLYLGHLHGLGFFHPARPHDFFAERACDESGGEMRLTMIDLDFKGLSPTPRPFDRGESIEALAQSCYLFYRAGHSATKVEARRFISGYKLGLRGQGQTLTQRILRDLVSAIDRRLLVHRSNRETMTTFPEVAESVGATFPRSGCGPTVPTSHPEV